MLLYPLSVFFLFIVMNVCLYFFKYNIYFIVICIGAILRFISIKPILDIIDKYVVTRYKSQIERIKHNVRESFIVQGNMTNTKQAIYILHPHGICSLTHVFHIGTDMTNWPYKNVKGVMHFLLSKIPFLLDFIDEDHVVDSTYTAMKEHVKTGRSMSMCLGNFTEGKYTDDTRITAIVKRRGGIFKMAIETGVPIIPVLSYGEQSKFKQLYTFGILEYLSKLTGLEINCPSFSCISEWLSIYKEPFKKKIYTHIGQPIEVGPARNPTKEEIHALRDKYMDALRSLYKETRPKEYEEEIVII